LTFRAGGCLPFCDGASWDMRKYTSHIARGS